MYTLKQVPSVYAPAFTPTLPSCATSSFSIYRITNTPALS